MTHRILHLLGKQFCEATCHNLGQYEPAVCGTDGYTYESPCQMQCSAVMQAADGECDSELYLHSTETRV